MRLQVSVISFGFSPHLADEMNPSGWVTHKVVLGTKLRFTRTIPLWESLRGCCVCLHLTQIWSYAPKQGTPAGLHTHPPPKKGVQCLHEFDNLRSTCWHCVGFLCQTTKSTTKRVFFKQLNASGKPSKNSTDSQMLVLPVKPKCFTSWIHTVVPNMMNFSNLLWLCFSTLFTVKWGSA